VTASQRLALPVPQSMHRAFMCVHIEGESDMVINIFHTCMNAAMTPLEYHHCEICISDEEVRSLDAGKSTPSS
jgi:hypothetical protein